jgi:Flp pilus assembly protein TadG
VRALLARLRRDRRGVSAIEFALVAPVLIFMVVGIAQIGKMFYAHSALSNAVAEGARFATIHPRPTEAQVAARVVSKRPPGATGTFTTPTVTYVRNATSGNWRATISMDYTVKLDFILFEHSVTLNSTRQASVYPPPTA